MFRFSTLPTLLACLIVTPGAQAAVEFIYTIKEKAFVQTDDNQPGNPVAWLFGAGASGDQDLTAMTLTVGSNSPVNVNGEPGSFDLETEPYFSQAALDAAYPNGSYSLSVTDGGNPQNLGPFTINGDAYPVVPYFTNATGLASHDLTQDYLLTWNTFSGADANDQIVLQVWDNDWENPEPELIFEFLPSSANSFTIPGGTFSPDGNYDIDILFINETDGLESPETIIGYLSTTTFYLSTSTSDTQFSFYKWKRYLQEGPETLSEAGYRPLATVIGQSNQITYAELNVIDGGSFPFGNPIAQNFYLFTTPFGLKSELDANYPSGEYNFYVEENGAFTNYGPFFLAADAYPAAPVIQDFNGLQVIDPTEQRLISWAAPPPDVDLVTVNILDDTNTIVWSVNAAPEVTSALLPGETLQPEANYRLVVRFGAETAGGPNPPSSLGYLTSTYFPFQTAGVNGGDPGIDFIYSVKERSFNQEDNTAPVDPFEWSFGAGVTGGSDVQGGSITYPGGSDVFSGEPGDYSSDDNRFSSKAELDAAFANGSYTLNVNLGGSNQEIGTFNLTGDSYPNAPHILNLQEFRSHDYSQNFTLTWAAFAGATEADRIVLEVWDRTSDQDLIFEFLPAATTSYEIPGGTLAPGRQYEFDILFVKETDGLETPETIIGYMSRTNFDLYTYTADTRLRFYKFQRNQQTGPTTIEENGYRPFAFVGSQSSTIASAGIETGSQFFVNLNNIGNNSFLLPLEFQAKESLDANYPAGPIRFFVNKNGADRSYGPFDLPPDAYPQAPRFQNFQELLLFDASGEQTIVWDAIPEGVTQLDVFASQGGSTVWSAIGLPLETTSTTIPANTFSSGDNFALIIRLWSNQVESGLLDASLGYATITIMNGRTLDLPSGNSGLIGLTIFELPTGRMRLAWNDIYENETAYVVERSLVGLNDFQEIANLGPNATSYEDDPPGEVNAYFYRIKVVLPGGGN